MLNGALSISRQVLDLEDDLPIYLPYTGSIVHSILRWSTQLRFLSELMPIKIERFRGFETLHGRQMLGVVSIDYA